LGIDVTGFEKMDMLNALKAEADGDPRKKHSA